MSEHGSQHRNCDTQRRRCGSTRPRWLRLLADSSPPFCHRRERETQEGCPARGRHPQRGERRRECGEVAPSGRKERAREGSNRQRESKSARRVPAGVGPPAERERERAKSGVWTYPQTQDRTAVHEPRGECRRSCCLLVLGGCGECVFWCVLFVCVVLVWCADRWQNGVRWCVWTCPAGTGLWCVRPQYRSAPGVQHINRQGRDWRVA